MTLLVSLPGENQAMTWVLFLLLPTLCLQAGFIHEHFKDRLILNWTQPQTSGVLRILDLKEKDQTVYFCRVHLKTTKGMEMVQSIYGTQITITRVSTTMQSPFNVTSADTTAGLEDTEGQRNPSLVNIGATSGVVVATAVLITPVCVMLIFLWWKKRHSTVSPQLMEIQGPASLTRVVNFIRIKAWWPHILRLQPLPSPKPGNQRAGRYPVL
ncbi:paired immunoglobulin-like type 2 receptor beta-2 isoform X3 [Alexandromys fortis]|uniref:paired immunoglobulin-like type 2 receptor beta-2 isoform X3 n=1 Tax=Alexandromys fortis TaxID=100897 RepID=UPI0021536E87|nr:paired immunoglobulin-like type 2 receptor beta-2 isoform X3 [Microtus fortis]